MKLFAAWLKDPKPRSFEELFNMRIVTNRNYLQKALKIWEVEGKVKKDDIDRKYHLAADAARYSFVAAQSAIIEAALSKQISELNRMPDGAPGLDVQLIAIFFQIAQACITTLEFRTTVMPAYADLFDHLLMEDVRRWTTLIKTCKVKMDKKLFQNTIRTFNALTTPLMTFAGSSELLKAYSHIPHVETGSQKH